MKLKIVLTRISFVISILLICINLSFGQGFLDKLKDKVNKVTNEAKNSTNVGGGNYQWARVEVRTSWTDNGEKKYENRVYYSNISQMDSARDYRQKENFINYFNDGIVEPMKGRGIELDYYDSDVEIYPLTTSYDSLEEAQKQMNDRLDVDKHNENAIYTFIWKYNGTATGEETTQPKRVFSIKPAPSIENTKAASNNNAAERQSKQKTQQQENELAQQKKEIWGYAILNVRVKNSKGEEFSRTYVSEIAPVTRNDYNAYYNTDERFIKPRIWEYFEKTVVQAAKSRGEEIEEPYDSSIMYKFTLDRDANGNPWFKPKSILEEPLTREISYAKESSHQVFYFRWDTSGKNIATDLQREMKRSSAELPN